MKNKTEQHKKRIGTAITSKWQDPIWRAQMIEKQKKMGLRPHEDNSLRSKK